MTGEYLTAPGLLAQIYLTTVGLDDAAAWDQVRSLWDDITSSLGLDRPIESLGVPARMPRQNLLPADGHGVVATAENGRPEVWQAVSYADGDLLSVTVMMAPSRDRDCARAWTDLERLWSETVHSASQMNRVIGESRIFLALIAPGDSPADEDAEIARDLHLARAAAPAPSLAGWWRHWDIVRLGSAGGQVPVWELGPESEDARAVRRLAIVAPQELERQIDYLVWTDGDGLATPLARHLGHAARLRYQIRVFDQGSASRMLREEIGSLVDAVSREPVVWSELGRSRWNRLWEGLERAQAAAAGLRMRLDAMRLAVGVISRNMKDAVSLLEADVEVGPLSEDQHLAKWFRERLDDEISRLDGAVASARSTSSLLAGPHGPASRALPNGTGPSSRRSPALAGPPEPRVVIFTALAVEYEAVRECMSGSISDHAEHGTLYEVGELCGARGSWFIAITQTGPGGATAGVQFERAVRIFEPDVAIFLGVAGGRKDVGLGDVVAADKVYDYESGKSTAAGHKPRMSSHKPAYRLVQHAQRVARESRWQQRIRPACPVPPPRAFVKPIATGGKVVADDRSEIARLLNDNADDVLAVETEGHGFHEGAYQNPTVDALVIRGISDLMTGKNPAGDEFWQPVASRHAAAFAVEFLDSLGMDRA